MSGYLVRQILALTVPVVSMSMWLAGTPPASASVPRCAAPALRLRMEQDDGQFSGMDQAGGIAIVRNVGATACTIPGGSAFEMRDGSGVGVASSAPTGARFMHHGPFVAPVELAPGAVAASQLRWIAANVFGSLPARSVSATSLALAMPGGGSVSVPLTATVWGRSSQPVAFTADRLTTALPELGPAAVSAPGTYVGEGPDGSTYLEGGTPVRELVLAPAGEGSLRFTYSAKAASAGSVTGTLAIHGTRATYADPANDCTLRFAFYGPQLMVGETGGCGLGNGGAATGQYRAR